MAWLALALPAACVVRPGDPFAAAEHALARQDLLAALQAFDAVPVAHARYPDARAAALAVERDMRRSHELLLRAMMLRAEWRDAEALDALREVQEIWPRMPAVEVLLAATRQRAAMFETSSRPAAPTIESAPPTVAAPPAGASAPAEVAAPTAVVAIAEPTPEPVAPPVEMMTNDSDAIGVGLAAVESQLHRGLLETAIVDLMALSQQFPADARVRYRLVRVLHQRGLVRYGEGSLAAAIADWRRVLELEPGHASARRLIEAAQLERR
jgi:hypothetical protein